jgi:hypothetical protein
MNITHIVSLSPRFPAVNTAEILRKKYLQAQKRYGLKAGDRVRVIAKAGDYQLGWRNTWELRMDSAVGKNFTVKSIDGATGVDLVEGEYWFPFFVLQKINTNPIRIPLKDGGEAIVTKGHTYIDGRPFSKGTLKRLNAAVLRMERNMA